jgi:hypothetical protein
VALHAVELLAARLRESRRPREPTRGVTPAEVDSVLWRAGGAPRYKAIPRHRTRCVYY